MKTSMPAVRYHSSSALAWETLDCFLQLILQAPRSASQPKVTSIPGLMPCVSKSVLSK